MSDETVMTEEPTTEETREPGLIGTIGERGGAVIGQVVDGTKAAYGRARGQFRDIAEDAPYIARQTGDKLRVAAKRSARVADDGVRDHPFLIAAVAGAGAYMLSWLIHGRRSA